MNQVKAVVRDFLIRIKVWKSVYRIKALLFDKKRIDYNRPIDHIFTEIYNKNYWGSKESLSGIGSQQDTTETVVRDIITIINEYNITSIVDVPCGDFFWMKNVIQNAKSCNYIGLDIVDDLIKKNNEQYSSTSIKFKTFDLTSEQLPYADLIICRDCLVHFSNEFALSAIENIKKSKAKYLLVTSFERVKNNVDILTGQWRPVNMTLPPFNLMNPIAFFFEKGTEDGYEDNKALLLYKLENLG